MTWKPSQLQTGRTPVSWILRPHLCVTVVVCLFVMMLVALLAFCSRDRHNGPASGSNQSGEAASMRKDRKAGPKCSPPLIIVSSPGWHVTIHQDGSGVFGYGSPIGVMLPEKTFDVSMIAKMLQGGLRPGNPAGFGDYTVTYYTIGHPNGQQYHVQSTAVITNLFEQCRIAYHQQYKNIVSGGTGGIEEAWRQQPPTPESKPWDAKAGDGDTGMGTQY
jgi:hypothetical protein